jgi:TPR repeat protein
VKDRVLCRHYFAKGAAHGDAEALYNLGLIYMYGLGGLPVNATKAHLLLRDAHGYQQANAPLLLAELHAEFSDWPGGGQCNLAMQYLWCEFPVLQHVLQMRCGTRGLCLSPFSHRGWII